MKIELHQYTIGEVVNGFYDSEEEGVIGFGGRLNIRPKYQREFVYDDKKQMAVMDTVWRGFPLNVMYWARNEDGTFELLDGQQRTLSICKYIAGEYLMRLDDSLRGWANLSPTQQQRILDYRLHIYVCEGSSDEKLDWFKIINIAGERLTDQELLNAIYSGEWLTSAKRRFSKTGCVAFRLAEKFMNGSPIRQAYLETALRWISDNHIQEYMAAHQHDSNSDELWQYFQSVIEWVRRLFLADDGRGGYYKEMKGVDWGALYNKYHDKSYGASALQARVAELMEDFDVTSKSGIFGYVLGEDERVLSIRAFDKRMVRTVYQRQEGVCPICRRHFEIEQMEADHITPWSEGGKTIAENCQMLCRDCNRHKSNR